MRTLSGRSAMARVRKLAGRNSELAAVEQSVQRIILDVRRQGDRALRRYAESWDGLEKGAKLRVTGDQMQAAWESSDPRFRSSLRRAAANIRRFCEWQKPVEWMRTRQGLSVGQLVRPLDSVGCYVPGGRYPLVSTLLMTVIPAQVAGVKNIRVVSPRPKREVLAAAAKLGMREVYRVGGAQAIAALAYGTETIPRVDKIVGPGNRWVTAAKLLVSGHVAIDLPAGPSEVLVVADETADADLCAADLLAQAEHGADGESVLVTTSAALAADVERLTVGWEQVRIEVVPSLEAALARVDDYAPEHLELHVADPAAVAERVSNAGSIFL